MQKIAAYLLERQGNLSLPESRAKEVATIKGQIYAWLEQKGKSGGEKSGTYIAQDGSHATYRIEDAVDGARSWWMVQLDEVTEADRLFRVAVSVTSRTVGIAVYVTMEVGSSATHISPIEVDPKCPKLVRQLLKLPGQWHHGGSLILPLRYVEGFEPGEGIAAEIKNPTRTMPIVVVATAEDGHLALPEIDEQLSYDLAGLANLVVVDAGAAWALTDHLGKSLSCFDGAVRIYWPRFRQTNDPFRHSLWTSRSLRAASEDLTATSRQFRQQIRGLVMKASALSVVRPQDIDEIRTAAARAAFADMKRHANSLSDFRDLADSYAKDNDNLRVANEALQRSLEERDSSLAYLELRLQNAEVQLRYCENLRNNIDPDPEPVVPDDQIPPEEGESSLLQEEVFDS